MEVRHKPPSPTPRLLQAKHECVCGVQASEKSPGPPAARAGRGRCGANKNPSLRLLKIPINYVINVFNNAKTSP